MKIGIYLPIIAVGTALIAIFTAHSGLLSNFTLQVFGIPANLVFWFGISFFVCALTIIEIRRALKSYEG